MTTRPLFSLTERERTHHIEALSSVLTRSDLSSQDAVRALECCAILIQDDFMTPHVDRKLVVSLLKAAFGKGPGSMKNNTTFCIEGRDIRNLVYQSSLIRGAAADLDLEMRLVQ